MTKEGLNFAISEALDLLTKAHDPEPPIPIYSLVRDAGLGIFEMPMRDHLSGVSGFIDLTGGPPRIVLNKDDSFARKSFTLAHELGHWQLHRQHLTQSPELGILYRRPIDGNQDSKEVEANAFAANLLVPPHLLRKYQSGSDDQLARLFGVSVEVIKFRRQAEGLW